MEKEDFCIFKVLVIEVSFVKDYVGKLSSISFLAGG